MLRFQGKFFVYFFPIFTGWDKCYAISNWFGQMGEWEKNCNLRIEQCIVVVHKGDHVF